MERSDGFESGVGTIESRPKPALFIVGAPGTGKFEIAAELGDRFPGKLHFHNEELENTNYALGSMADYRVELKLALDRSLEQPESATIYTHSVLDNLAWLSFAISRYKLGTVSEDTMQRAVLAWTLTGLILSDSFKHDHVFFLQGDFDPNDDYESAEMQIILQMILDQYQINYSIIDINDNPVEKIGETLETYL